MTQPACVPTREPLSDTLLRLARLRLKLLVGTLPIIAGFLYAAVTRSPNPLLRVPELPSRIARCFPEAGTSRVRALGCTGVYGSAAARTSLTCHTAVHVPHRNPVTKGAFRGRHALAPRDFSRARALECTDCTDSAPPPDLPAQDTSALPTSVKHGTGRSLPSAHASPAGS